MWWMNLTGWQTHSRWRTWGKSRKTLEMCCLALTDCATLSQKNQIFRWHLLLKPYMWWKEMIAETINSMADLFIFWKLRWIISTQKESLMLCGLLEMPGSLRTAIYGKCLRRKLWVWTLTLSMSRTLDGQLHSSRCSQGESTSLNLATVILREACSFKVRQYIYFWFIVDEINIHELVQGFEEANSHCPGLISDSTISILKDKYSQKLADNQAYLMIDHTYKSDLEGGHWPTNQQLFKLQF